MHCLHLWYPKSKDGSNAVLWIGSYLPHTQNTSQKTNLHGNIICNSAYKHPLLSAISCKIWSYKVNRETSIGRPAEPSDKLHISPMYHNISYARATECSPPNSRHAFHCNILLLDSQLSCQLNLMNCVVIINPEPTALSEGKSVTIHWIQRLWCKHTSTHEHSMLCVHCLLSIQHDH